MIVLDKLRGNRKTREAARYAIIAILAVTAFLTGRATDDLRADVVVSTEAANTNANSVKKVEKILADVCEAAPDKDVQKAGRNQECRLAKEGKIEVTVPVVTPQVRVQYEPVPAEEIERVVDTYLDNRLRELPDQYRTALRQAVVEYLRENPPPAGPAGKDGAAGKPPTAAQIAQVVAQYVAANPPPAGRDGTDGKDGKDGARGEPGVSVTSAVLDGCDVVFSFSNDTTVRVGPICGPAGKDGVDGKNGVDGKDGAKGDTGRGVVSTNCVPGDEIDQDGDGTAAATDWLITYDQPDSEGKTSQRVDGPCRVEPGEDEGP